MALNNHIYWCNRPLTSLNHLLRLLVPFAYMHKSTCLIGLDWTGWLNVFEFDAIWRLRRSCRSACAKKLSRNRRNACTPYQSGYTRKESAYNAFNCRQKSWTIVSMHLFRIVLAFLASLDHQIGGCGRLRIRGT